jgi:hypothetical protein
MRADGFEDLKLARMNQYRQRIVEELARLNGERATS